MPSSEQTDQEAVEHRLLPDDHLANLALDAFDEDRFLLDEIVDSLDVLIHRLAHLRKARFEREILDHAQGRVNFGAWGRARNRQNVSLFAFG